MVKANELRIGNYLLNSENRSYFKVHEFLSDRVRKITASCSTIAYKMEEVEGILLSEEWLKKMGFKSEYGRSTGDTFTMEKGRICLFELPKGWHFNVKGDYGDIHIQYVHQLQNLYFALTGEELEVKNDH